MQPSSAHVRIAWRAPQSAHVTVARRACRAFASAGLALLAGCAVTLPGGDLGGAPAPSASATSAAVMPGCLPFRAIAGVDAATGAVRSVSLPDGSTLLVVDDAIVSGVDVPSLELTTPPGASLADCLAAATLSGDEAVSALDPPTLSPLSGYSASGAAMLYYTDASMSAGVASRDPSDGRFRPSGVPLWTSDRPAFGTAAAVTGDDVETIGCRSARYLDADCFVARAPLARAGDESAYEYYVGGGRWSPRIDDAWPATSGEGSIDVAFLPSENEWVMAYVAPLARTIFLRRGLSPEGPWSAPVAAATCDLSDGDMFCGVHLHPALFARTGSIVLSYSAGSLSPEVAARRAAEPMKWWPRFVELRVPTFD